MIKFKGTTLYPPAMYNVLNHFRELDAFVIEIFHNDVGTDEILIKITAKIAVNNLIKVFIVLVFLIFLIFLFVFGLYNFFNCKILMCIICW